MSARRSRRNAEIWRGGRNSSCSPNNTMSWMAASTHPTPPHPTLRCLPRRFQAARRASWCEGKGGCKQCGAGPLERPGGRQAGQQEGELGRGPSRERERERRLPWAPPVASLGQAAANLRRRRAKVAGAFASSLVPCQRPSERGDDRRGQGGRRSESPGAPLGAHRRRDRHPRGRGRGGGAKRGRLRRLLQARRLRHPPRQIRAPGRRSPGAVGAASREQKQKAQEEAQEIRQECGQSAAERMPLCGAWLSRPSKRLLITLWYGCFGCNTVSLDRWSAPFEMEEKRNRCRGTQHCSLWKL